MASATKRNEGRSAMRRGNAPTGVPVHRGVIAEAVQTRAKEIHRRLAKAMPEPKVELDHQNAWHLLVATILAARSNDRTINEITPELFRRVPSRIIVDVHVTRLVERFGLTTEKDPVKIEALLCELVPKRAWVDIGHRLVLHGRHVCTARKPRCEHCPLNEVCPSAAAEPAGRWTERAEWERVLTESRGTIDPLRPHVRS
jgi:endonuclease III